MRSVAFLVVPIITFFSFQVARAEDSSAPPRPAEPAAPATPAAPTSAPTPEPNAPSEQTARTEPVPEEGPSGRDIVAAYNAGFHWGFSPGVFIPSNGGKGGFTLSADFRYGFDTGPVIVAPGVRLAGFFPSGSTVMMGLGLVRVTLPIGHFAPFVRGGLGPGHISDPSYTGVVYHLGAGAMVHFSERFGLGVDAAYDKFAGTNFSVFSIGPSLLIAF